MSAETLLAVIGAVGHRSLHLFGCFLLPSSSLYKRMQSLAQATLTPLFSAV
ncbi:MAG: hypothetical protein J1E60_07815 [Christensenellaceae bacterium]|nr:hypothetical protein [Christensenellaceae bacterium]